LSAFLSEAEFAWLSSLLICVVVSSWLFLLPIIFQMPEITRFCNAGFDSANVALADVPAGNAVLQPLSVFRAT
jgi:hypothetical protein